MTDYNAIEKQVDQLLADNSIEFKALFCGATVRDGRECDAWRVFFDKPRQLKDNHWVSAVSVNFEYYTDTGHRNKRGKAQAPNAASVLHYLVSDYTLAQDTFEGFCHCLGYDTDSRKVLDLYLHCQKNGSELQRILGGTLLAQLEELLQDY